jgi:hypothetical protein
LEELASVLRARMADLSEAEIPSAEAVASEAMIEIETHRGGSGTERSAKRALPSTSNRSLSKGLDRAAARCAGGDLQKNKDAQKLRDLGSTLADTFAPEHCPTCARPIADTLLAQRVGADPGFPG